MRLDDRVLHSVLVGEGDRLLDRLEPNCTSFNVSAALDQPINGSGSRRLAGSYSRSHFLFCRRPDCIAVLDGR